MKPLKIALTGVESTGKSTLAHELATFFQTAYIPEFAREYLTHLKGNYTRQDVLNIAEEQIERQNDTTVLCENYIFYDTELTVIKIWYENLYGDLPAYLQKAYVAQHFDLYLLPYPDLAWEEDALREHKNEQKRWELFQLYEYELKKQNRLYSIITGSGQARLENALQAIKSLRN